MLEKRWTDCVALEGDYVDEQSRVLPKKCVFPSYSRDLLIHVLCGKTYQNTDAEFV